MNTWKIPANDPSVHDLDIAEIPNGIIDYDISQLSLAEDLLSWIKNAPPLPIDLQKELERNNILSLDSLSEVIQTGKENEKYHVIEEIKSSLKPIPKKKFDNYLSQSFPSLTPKVVKNKIPPDTQSVSFPNLKVGLSGVEDINTVRLKEIKQFEGSIFCAKCSDTMKLGKITSDVLNDEENQNDYEEEEEGNFEEVSSVDGNDGMFEQSSVISDSDDESDANEDQDAEEGNLKDNNISPGFQKRQKDDNEDFDDKKRDGGGRREKVFEESKSTGMFTVTPTSVVEVISSLFRSEFPELVLHCNRCGEQNSEESRNCVKCGIAFLNLHVKVKSEKKR